MLDPWKNAWEWARTVVALDKFGGDGQRRLEPVRAVALELQVVSDDGGVGGVLERRAHGSRGSSGVRLQSRGASGTRQ